MEEKERYKILYFDNDTSWKIIDNKTKKEVGGIDDMIKLLNQQDKRIKELEQENLFLQEQSIRDNQNWIEETTQLKQAQNKKAIEELEGLQVQCQFSITFADYKQEQILYDYINDRIKELKGEKE